MTIKGDGSVDTTTWQYLFGYNAYPSSDGVSGGYKDYTLYFGRILTNIWIWSGQVSASIISTPLTYSALTYFALKYSFIVALRGKTV